MLTLTRVDAVTHARYVFNLLAHRAYEVAGEDAEYVRLLARSWDERMSELAQSAAATAISDGVWASLNSLVSTVSDDTLTAESLIEWVDAFPDAVVSMIPASAEIAFEDELEHGDEDVVEVDAVPTRNQQSTLALAA